MTAIEALEQAHEKIAKLDLAHFLYLDRFISLGCFQKTILNTIDAIISAERDAEETKPEPGDVVAWPNPPHGHVMIGLYGRDWTSDIGLVVLMRAAEVKRRIEEGK